jgi:hypothetical protein
MTFGEVIFDEVIFDEVIFDEVINHPKKTFPILFLFVVQHFYECLTEDDAEL